MKQIVTVKLTHDDRWEVRLGHTVEYYKRLDTDNRMAYEDRIRVAADAMHATGYAKQGVWIAGWDDANRDVITYTRLPFLPMSLVATRRMMEAKSGNNAIEGRDWFYY